MNNILLLLDILGIVSFSLAGAILAIKKGFDIFGVNILAIITSVGGGCMRDLMLGKIPPTMLTKPVYIIVASICATSLFIIIYFHVGKENINNKHLLKVYDRLMFILDTVGLATFTIDGELAAYSYLKNPTVFIVVFMGVITGIGGGILRDITVNKLPSVFVKHVYAVASIAGALTTALLYNIIDSRIAMALGGILIILIRCLAAHFKWELPSIKNFQD